MRCLHHFVARLLFVVVCLSYGSSIVADSPNATPAGEKADQPQPTRFIRVQYSDDKRPLALQTATARYVAMTGEGDLTVDLIGVVHIGDKPYYDKLNKQFEQYDVLLYELVAMPEDRVPMKDRGGDNPLAMIQKVMHTVLDLTSQTDHVDYTKANFVHADLSPEEMMKKIRERGDDGLTLTLSVAADFLRQQNLQKLAAENSDDPDAEEPAEEFDPLALLTDPSGPTKMKVMMAEQFEAQADPAAGLGKTLQTILIDDRNATAMKVFQTEMAKGKKRIGIFYGAAHMPDFEKRLTAEFGLRRESVTWQTAWDLRPRGISSFERLLKLLDE